jgi:hypothetical protein
MICTASSLNRRKEIFNSLDFWQHFFTVFRTSNGRPTSTPASAIAFAKYKTYSSSQEVELDNIAVHPKIAANATSILG